MSSKVIKTNFKIKNIPWKCLFVSQHDETNSDIKDNMGLTKFSGRTILIDDSLKEPDLSATIIHELTHAFIWEYGFYQATFTHEIVCDFFGVYGKEIININNLILSKRNILINK